MFPHSLANQTWTVYWCPITVLTNYHKRNDLNGEGNGNPCQYSCLENPMDKGDWGAIVHGSAKKQTWLSTHTHMQWLKTTEFILLEFWEPEPARNLVSWNQGMMRARSFWRLQGRICPLSLSASTGGQHPFACGHILPIWHHLHTNFSSPIVKCLSASLLQWHLWFHLTLEQHRFELCGSTYTQIFSPIYTTILHDMKLVESTMWNHKYSSLTMAL